jgi:hypothetical protein
MALRRDAHVVDGHDVRMLELGSDLRLLDELHPVMLRIEEFLRQHLHRHGAPAVDIARLVDGAHAALRDDRPADVFPVAVGAEVRMRLDGPRVVVRSRLGHGPYPTRA